MVHARKTEWQYHIIFFTNTVLNAAVLCTTSVSQFLLNETRKERDITKLKPLGHSDMQNM